MSIDLQNRAADTFSKDFAARLFQGRKGHGNGPVSYMQLSEPEVANLIHVSFKAGETFAEGVLRAALREAIK